MQLHFLMAGGGTGGHVLPAIAVARVLKARGHAVTFLGTRTGMEARLVPEAGFPIEWIRIGALKRVGLLRRLRTAWELPVAIAKAWRLLRRLRISAVLSTGGFAAGPAVAAALLCGVPVAAMEPNAAPGFTTRMAARWVSRALINLDATARWFPADRVERTGWPVREEFFAVPAKAPVAPFTVLISGGSQGSRTLNRAVRQCWPLAAASGKSVRLIMQAGKLEGGMMAEAWAAFEKPATLQGEVTEFIRDMAASFAEADLIICRSGAGAVAELAAAGKPSILIPLPFASDDHQTKNAAEMTRAGAARMARDFEWTGERMWSEISSLLESPESLESMGEAARKLARPGAAERAAAVLEELAREKALGRIDTGP